MKSRGDRGPLRLGLSCATSLLNPCPAKDWEGGETGFGLAEAGFLAENAKVLSPGGWEFTRGKHMYNCRIVQIANMY